MRIRDLVVDVPGVQADQLRFDRCLEQDETWRAQLRLETGPRKPPQIGDVKAGHDLLVQRHPLVEQGNGVRAELDMDGLARLVDIAPVRSRYRWSNSRAEISYVVLFERRDDVEGTAEISLSNVAKWIRYERYRHDVVPETAKVC